MPFHPKNQPKGRKFTYLEDPGICYRGQLGFHAFACTNQPKAAIFHSSTKVYFHPKSAFLKSDWGPWYFLSRINYLSVEFQFPKFWETPICLITPASLEPGCICIFSIVKRVYIYIYIYIYTYNISYYMYWPYLETPWCCHQVRNHLPKVEHNRAALKTLVTFYCTGW